MPARLRLLPVVLLLISMVSVSCSSERESIDAAIQAAVQAQTIERAAKATVEALSAATATAQLSIPAPTPPAPPPGPASNALGLPTPPATPPGPASNALGLPTPPAFPTATEAPPVPTHSAGYVPVLGMVNGIECEYDAFRDTNVCVESIDSMPLRSYALVDGNIVIVYALLVQPKGQPPQMRWTINYSGEDWIFVQQIIFLYDGKRHVVDFNYLTQRISKVLDGGMVFEGVVVPVESIEAIIDILTANDFQVRLAGQSGNIDKTVSDHEKQVLLRALATYEKLGGQLPANRDKLKALIPKETPQDASAVSTGASKTGIINGSSVNLRNGPGSEYGVVGQATNGTKVAIVETSADGAWYKLADGNWISASLVTVESTGP